MAATRSRNTLGGGRNGSATLSDLGDRGRRKSRAGRKEAATAKGRLGVFRGAAARLRRLGATLWARGPLILATAGAVFFLGVVIFLFVVPLPPPVVPVATRVFDRNGELIGSLYSQNRIPVSVSEVPEVLRKGIVAVEDERFYSHHGLDAIGLARAAVRNLLAGRIVEGGSTITAQVARTLYLTHEVTVSRKIIEALLALKLERAYSKEEILQLYLNQIYLGNGAYGVEVASQTYFGKSVRDLDTAEAAMIAGLPSNPEGYSPYNHPDRALHRRNLVIDIWVKQGVITADQAAATKAEPLKLASTGPPAPVGSYFMDYVVTLIREAGAAGARLPTLNELYVGGYRIYTTLDVKMQKAAEEAVKNFMPAGRKDSSGVTQPQVALVAMDPTNGYILAMVGGRSFAETKLNRAVPPGPTGTAGMRRQPGSAFKAFLYTAVVDSGFPLTSTQVCEPVQYPAGNGEIYSPEDYGKEPYHYRPLTVREAVRISDNVVAVKWAARIGPAREKSFANMMGIDSPLTVDLSLALGSSEVSVLEMARGYSTLANGGFRVQPLALLRLEDRYGRPLLSADHPGRPQFGQAPGVVGRVRLQRAIDERVAYIVNRLFQEPFNEGGTAAHLLRYFPGRQVAGKTGTTDRQFDAWFIGYTPQVVCAVWVGNDTPSPLPGYGGTLAGPVWGNFMAAAHDGLPVVDFPEPAGIVHLEVCALTGLLPNPTCPRTREIFLPGTEPRQVDPTFHWLGTGTGTKPAVAPEAPAAAGAQSH